MDSCVEPDPEIKTSRSHYKILLKLTEIYWKWLSMAGSYSVQSSVAKTTRGPQSSVAQTTRGLHVKSGGTKLVEEN